MGSALRRVPAWAWLTAIVAGSVLARAILVRGIVAPFIIVDEVIWSELARGIADAGKPLLRDQPDPGYSVVYPLLISPAYALFDSLPDAYAAVKAVNALLMSLAAVPAFFLARRVARDGLALLAAVLTVAVPSLAYTGTVMTENAFYPLFLLVVLVLVIVLERPTPLWVVLLLVLAGAAYRDPGAGGRARTGHPARAAPARDLRAARPALDDLAISLAVRARRRARRRRPRGWARPRTHTAGSARRLFAGGRSQLRRERRAALPVVARRRAGALRPRDPARRDDRARRARSHARRAAAGVPRGDGCSDRLHRPDGGRVRVGVLRLASRSETCSTWRRSSASRSSPGSTSARRGPGCSRRSLQSGPRSSSSRSRSTGSSRLRRSRTRSCCFRSGRCRIDIGESWVPIVALALAAVLAAAFLFVPGRYALVLPLLVLGLWILAVKPIWFGNARIRAILARCAVPGDPDRRSRLDRSEASERRARRLPLDGPHRPAHGEPERVLQPGGRAGLLRHGPDARRPSRDPRPDRPEDGSGHAPRREPRAGSVPAGGLVVRSRRHARSQRDKGWGVTLWRVRPPLVSAALIEGLYPNDTWSGPTVTYTRRRCAPGRLSVALSSDANLFILPQTGRRALERSDHRARTAEPRRKGAPERPRPARARNDGLPRRLHGDADGDSGRGHGRWESRPPRARRPLQSLRLQAAAVRIAFDVSPLSHPLLGIGNYIQGSLGGLAEAAAGEHEIVAFAPTSIKGPRRIRAALGGDRRRGAHVAAALLPRGAHGMERAGPPGSGAAARRVRRPSLLGLDVPAPARGRARDDDPRPRAASPSRVDDRQDAVDARSQVRERGDDVRRRLRELGLHRARCHRDARRPERADSCRASRAEGRSSVRTGPPPISVPRTSSPSRLSSRGRICRCSSRRTGCSEASSQLAVVGAEGWGEQPLLDAPRHPPTRVRLGR